jgi:hypothetical protein
MESLGFSRATEGILEWENLAAAARSDFVKQTFDSLLDLVGAAAEAAVKNGSKLYPVNVNDFIEHHSIENQQLTDFLHRLALRNKNDPLWTTRVLTQIKTAGAAKDLVFMDDLSVVLSQALSLAKNERINEYAYLLSALQFTSASIYNNVTRRVSVYQINQLANRSEVNLKSLQTLTALLKEDVADLKSAKTAKASCGSAASSSAMPAPVQQLSNLQQDGSQLGSTSGQQENGNSFWEAQLQQERLKALSQNDMAAYNQLVEKDLDIYRQHGVDPCDSSYFKEGCQH